jgi:hypothetical protein
MAARGFPGHGLPGDRVAVPAGAAAARDHSRRPIGSRLVRRAGLRPHRHGSGRPRRGHRRGRGPRSRARSGGRRRVVLVGFSQGGALALHAGLSLGPGSKASWRFATALHCRPPTRVAPPARRAPSLFLGPWTARPRGSLMPSAHDTWRRLTALGYSAEWHSYWCGHVVSPRLLRDVRAWLEGDRTPAGERSRAAARRLGWSAFPTLRVTAGLDRAMARPLPLTGSCEREPSSKSVVKAVGSSRGEPVRHGPGLGGHGSRCAPRSRRRKSRFPGPRRRRPHG